MVIEGLLSAYFCEQWLERRIGNARMAEIPLAVSCQVGSPEHYILTNLNYPCILTKDVPSLYATWNELISRSRADILIIANSDDLWLPDIRKTVLDSLRDPADYYYPDHFESRKGELVLVENRFRYHGPASFKRGNFAGHFSWWKRSIHQKYGLYDPAYDRAGDLEFWFRMAAQGGTFRHVSRPAGIYLYRADSYERADRKSFDESRRKAAARWLESTSPLPLFPKG